MSDWVWVRIVLSDGPFWVRMLRSEAIELGLLHV